MKPTAAASASSLYECTVRHERFAPKQHRFAYRLFYFALDLDEVDSLPRRLALFSTRRPNLFRFRERVFLPTGEALHNATTPATRLPAAPLRPAPSAPSASSAPSSLKSRALAFCAAHGVDCGPLGHVVLVTLPQVLGFQFNPVSFYFCFDSAGQPAGVIAEVTNTYHEVKLYFVPPAGAGDRPGPAVFRARQPKHFYVSPFSGLDLEFDLTLVAPAEKLAVRIDDYAGSHRVFHSTLTGRRVPLTDARLAWFLVKYPLATIMVVVRIHWQALRLWLKRLPYFAKSAGAANQSDLYRPHPSIARSPSS